VTTAPDLFTLAQTALSASTTTSGEIATWYCATARLALTQATEKLQALERVLIARERELAHAAKPKQLAKGSEAGG
jgi:hypothetical protein